MPRIVKSAEERRLEIILTSEKLFRENGYSKTSVDAIIKEMGVAKGTFYYYFKSKEKVLEAIVEHMLAQIVEMSEQIADDGSMDALTKMQLLLSGNNIGREEAQDVAEHLHLPENRELHEVSNVQTVIKLSPIIAKIFEQGNEEGVFDTKYPLAVAQFLLTGSQFLLDGGLFDFNEAEVLERRLVMQEIIEKALGAKSGTFDFLNA
ncbi:MAG: TetR/AcrR family transcriptional regulator [Chloroflexi bacterium]|nr:TetR/AcrR family transcriptional regulator [Chloroflexota bacterium]